MTISYGITSIPHPERRKLRNEVVRELERPTMITEDARGEGPMWNMVQNIRMMQNFYPAAYYVVFQDDVRLAKHLAFALESAMPAFFAEHPQAVLSLFNNTAKAREAKDKGHVYFRYPMTGRNWLWVYGIVLPAQTANRLASFYEQCALTEEWPERVISQRVGKTFVSSDSFLSAFIRLFEYEAWCVTQSLVQHIGGNMSQLGHNFPPESGKNYSPNFVGRDRDAITFLTKATA